MDEVQQNKHELYAKLLKYPPFYTQIILLNRLQDHRETREKQKTYWSEIVHQHLKQNKILESSISEMMNCPIFQDNSTGVPKRLNSDEIREIFIGMEKLGTIEWKGEQNFSVNWTSQFELADSIYQWAKDQKMIGYTETLKGISEGEQTDKKLKFYDLPQEQILRACQILEQTGRAEVYEFEGMFSVKFK